MNFLFLSMSLLLLFQNKLMGIIIYF